MFFFILTPHFLFVKKILSILQDKPINLKKYKILILQEDWIMEGIRQTEYAKYEETHHQVSKDLLAFRYTRGVHP